MERREEFNQEMRRVIESVSGKKEFGLENQSRKTRSCARGKNSPALMVFLSDTSTRSREASLRVSNPRFRTMIYAPRRALAAQVAGPDGEKSLPCTMKS